ncbi:hypothetical protein D9M69_451520 [compost metagenome]
MVTLDLLGLHRAIIGALHGAVWCNEVLDGAERTHELRGRSFVHGQLRERGWASTSSPWTGVRLDRIGHLAKGEGPMWVVDLYRIRKDSDEGFSEENYKEVRHCPDTKGAKQGVRRCRR